MADISGVIHPTRVRYIKLGEAGGWEKECREKGIIRFGFGTATAERFELCRRRQWDGLTKSFVAEGKTKSVANRFTKETRLFFEDGGSTLWITFIGECLYWGMLAPGSPERHLDYNGVLRTVVGGWRATDVNGETLTKDRLSGALTKLTAYRGTSCDVDVADYVIRRINGEKTPEVERGVAALEEMKRSVLPLMKLLVPQDFELLVDLVFSTSGWRRQGSVGKTQKTLDLDVTLPSTDRRRVRNSAGMGFACAPSFRAPLGAARCWRSVVVVLFSENIWPRAVIPPNSPPESES